MYKPTLLLLTFQSVTNVLAGIYVTSPVASTTCHGGLSCTVSWIDDGTSPSLNDLGLCSVALYTGTQQVVQSIDPVDVSASDTVTFAPDPQAGPASSAYYIGFTSAALKDNGTAALAFSAFFTLDGMNGSFDSPVPLDVSPRPASFASQTLTSSTTSAPPSPSISQPTSFLASSTTSLQAYGLSTYRSSSATTPSSTASKPKNAASRGAPTSARLGIPVLLFGLASVHLV